MPELSGGVVAACGAAMPVREFQAIQTRPDAVILRVVPAARFTSVDAARLREGVAKLVGPGMGVTVELVASIPIEPSGKRLVIRTEGRLSVSAADG